MFAVAATAVVLLFAVAVFGVVVATCAIGVAFAVAAFAVTGAVEFVVLAPAALQLLAFAVVAAHLTHDLSAEDPRCWATMEHHEGPVHNGVWGVSSSNWLTLVLASELDEGC